MKVYCDACGHIYMPRKGTPLPENYLPGKPDIACTKDPRGTLQEVTPGIEFMLKAIKHQQGIAEHRAGMLKQVYEEAHKHGLIVSHTPKGIRLTKREKATA